MAKKTLAQALADLRKKSVDVGPLSDFNMEVDAISTGNVALDLITGVGGIPKGRITELFGLPSSGKTTTALQAAATLQMQGGTTLYLDYEQSLDPVYCKALGLDTTAPTFLYMRPRSFEEGANAFRHLNETGEIRLLVVDSVARMVTESELSADTGKVTFADRAKMMHQFMRQIVGPIQESATAVIFLNHVLEVVDTSPMGQQLKARGVSRRTTPGGAALKYYSSLRMEFKQIGNLRTEVLDPLTNEKSATIRQTKVEVTVVKNKVGDPFKKAELRVRFGQGFSQAWTVIDILTAYGVLKKETGGVYRLAPEVASPHALDKPWIKGEDNMVTAVESDPDWLAKLTILARETLEANMVTADPTQYDADGEPADIDAILEG